MNTKPPDPGLWGLPRTENGELGIGSVSCVELAGRYGTPLFVINDEKLTQAARSFKTAASDIYPGKVSVHYPFKCNAVPAVLEAMKASGLGAEVMTDIELELALRCGFGASEIIVNGPCKTAVFLERCLALGVGAIVVDSLQELELLGRLSALGGCGVDVLLRINPDYVPTGMNAGSATASRRGSVFGLDLKGGELAAAFMLLGKSPEITFRGIHLHIGTGIRRPQDYRNALACLGLVRALAREAHVRIDRLDVGGGFASPTSREFTAREMLLYQLFGMLPGPRHDAAARPEAFLAEISRAVQEGLAQDVLPELILEPGRVLTSQSGILLLSVHYVKTRPRIGTWLVTDGGLGTVTLPTFYEYHEIILCNEVERPVAGKVTLTGPACFSGDVIYRGKHMPKVQRGEVIAIMDAGAYFTQLESNFGFPKTAIVAVRDGASRLIRRRETLDDIVRRDEECSSSYQEETHHAIRH